ncbi:spore germination protein [Alicyclobacillus tolerans]|uniref:spore germination protein n=1 Tax=Alicyclobacillus tolerans TaxID=90970 RepID=UPI001F1C6107|nr:spore germination protein [Alicyclobacillus tolerans]MCF8563880.1 spore germination protein [Alicyclobacillus tolerans]
MPSWFKRLLTVDDSILNDQFTLGPPDQPQSEASQPAASFQPTRADQAEAGHDEQVEGSRGAYGQLQHSRSEPPDGKRHRKWGTEAAAELAVPTNLWGETFTAGGKNADQRAVRPIPLKELTEHAEDEEGLPEDTKFVSSHLDRVKDSVGKIFHLPKNKDIVVRDFTIGTEHPWRALAVFVDGISDKSIINTHVLEPLMYLTRLTEEGPERRMKQVSETLVPSNQISIEKTWQDTTSAILAGATAIFIDGCASALIVETKGWEHRTVGLPQTETVVRGPHDAFTENFRANTGLVRSKLRSENLVTEMMSVGRLGKTDIAVMYVEGLTNPNLIQEVKRRIEGIDVDYLADSGMMEQFIEEDPHVWVPQVMSTERPDRIAHMLTEGHVAIFVGQSPFVLAVPVVFWSMMQTPEDAYIKVPFGTFLRFIRWSALFVAMFLPGIYISVTNYHPEMIPTDLLLAVAGSREQVPFPVVVEVLLMEFAIELIREAGIRIPTVIGPTIGIVGALIIGQAAVQAGVVSPLLVIVVAVTALASFTIPNYNLSIAVRVGRFLFLAAAAFFGFYGMALVWCVVTAALAMQKSFGVPLMAPVVPSMDSSPDVFVRGPDYTMNERPSFLFTQSDWRQQPVTRPWSRATRRAGKSWFRSKGGKS